MIDYTEILIDWKDKMDYLDSLPWTLEKEIKTVMVNLYYTDNWTGGDIEI